MRVGGTGEEPGQRVMEGSSKSGAGGTQAVLEPPRLPTTHATAARNWQVPFNETDTPLNRLEAALTSSSSSSSLLSSSSDSSSSLLLSSFLALPSAARLVPLGFSAGRWRDVGAQRAGQGGMAANAASMCNGGCAGQRFVHGAVGGQASGAVLRLWVVI